ncbi:MAG: tetratricopeptide repeat protein [Thiobacillus sp.]
MSTRPLLYALSAAGLLTGGLLLAQSSAPARAAPDYDPLLQAPGAVCVSGAPSRQLIGYYQKLAAAKTEVRPFPTNVPAGGDDAFAPPPLWDNLGKLHFAIGTKNPLAQRYFDQGLKLAYAFNHAEAARAFRQAQRLDPDCALCHWGEALVLGPNINAPMDPAAGAAALAAITRAQALAPKAGARERELIAALARRYSGDAAAERGALDAAYAEAMGKVAARYPRDADITLLYVEALMNLSPWDYWEAAGARPKGRTAEILAALENVLQRQPDHPGASHYYIHMVEASSTPRRALPYADRLGSQMPGAGHLVHMPFHIYYRVGQYKDAIEANRRAVAADEAYLAEARPEGIYPLAYYPHNIHSLMTSAQMAGDGASAIAASEKLAHVVSQDAGRSIAWVQPILVAPYFAHAQFSAPATTLALPDPGDELPYVKAMWHYARGVAHAWRGEPAAARAEVDALRRLAQGADFSGLVEAGVPAPAVIALAQHVVLGRIAQSAGDWARARAEFEQAVALEDTLAYSEPPSWYYPVRQSLGAVLLAAGKLDEAETVFRQSLLRAPNNGWALHGLAATYQRLGKPSAATTARSQFTQAWVGPDAPDLARL